MLTEYSAEGTGPVSDKMTKVE